jgi:hypothetical protein
LYALLTGRVTAHKKDLDVNRDQDENDVLDAGGAGAVPL